MKEKYTEEDLKFVPLFTNAKISFQQRWNALLAMSRDREYLDRNEGTITNTLYKINESGVFHSTKNKIKANLGSVLTNINNSIKEKEKEVKELDNKRNAIQLVLEDTNSTTDQRDEALRELTSIYSTDIKLATEIGELEVLRKKMYNIHKNLSTKCNKTKKEVAREVKYVNLLKLFVRITLLDPAIKNTFSEVELFDTDMTESNLCLLLDTVGTTAFSKDYFDYRKMLMDKLELGYNYFNTLVEPVGLDKLREVNPTLVKKYEEHLDKEESAEWTSELHKKCARSEFHFNILSFIHKDKTLSDVYINSNSEIVEHPEYAEMLKKYVNGFAAVNIALKDAQEEVIKMTLADKNNVLTLINIRESKIFTRDLEDSELNNNIILILLSSLFTVEELSRLFVLYYASC